METKLPLIVVGHVQDADLVLFVLHVMIVVMVRVRLANVLVSALNPADSFNCIAMFRNSSFMLQRSVGWGRDGD